MNWQLLCTIAIYVIAGALTAFLGLTIAMWLLV